MEMVHVLKMLFIASVSVQLGHFSNTTLPIEKHVYGKHVYVKEHLPWFEAQSYCRLHHTDLSPMTRRWVERRLNIAMGNWSEESWIGLYKKETQWLWSGGGNASKIPWDVDRNEPDGSSSAGCLCWQSCGWNGWHNVAPSVKMYFFCFDLTVVEKEKSWEEALEYCRVTYTDLTSLVSETENLLALSEIKPPHITGSVWIGLRYLGDRWLWVNRDPLKYEAWHKRADQDHQCPMWNRCGALNQQGLWENRDCQEKLKFICY